MRSILKCSLVLFAGLLSAACNGDSSPGQPQSAEQAVQSRDMTSGETWIERLDRPDRIPGLRIDAVIQALGLEDGDVIADIGAGPGAYSIPFARAVAPSGKVLAVDIWPELLDYIETKAAKAGVDNIQTILCKPDDPMLPRDQVDIAYFHDVFHNVPDRQAYLEKLVAYLKPTSRIVIIEQEYDDPIAKQWDVPEDRITREQVDLWMSSVGFRLVDEHDTFQGANNPPGTGMPERWFVVYARAGEQQ